MTTKRKISFEYKDEFAIGFLLDFITVNNDVMAVIETKDGTIAVKPVDEISFKLKKHLLKIGNVNTSYDKESKISPEQILNVVSKVTMINIDDIKSKVKKRHFAYARYIYAALSYKFRPRDSMYYTGLHIGAREHSTISNARYQHKICIAYDDYKDMYNRCEAEIKAII